MEGSRGIPRPCVVINKKLFAELEGEKLLEHIRSSNLDGAEVQLTTVLSRISNEYEQDGLKEGRKLRRQKRIEIYDNLLRVALEAEGEDSYVWNNDPGHWKIKKSKHLVPGSVYTYLLDRIIHEDEEIMFLYYHSKKLLREHALWLVESIQIYRMYLVNPIIKKLEDWVEGEHDKCRGLLDEAKALLKEKLLSHESRSWRSRARMYWLLARAKHAPISKGRVFNFKNPRYRGPISILVQEMIEDDEDMLLDKVHPHLNFEYVKPKHDKKGNHLGTLRVSSLLAWASAANDGDFVKSILEHKKEYIKRDECDSKREELWARDWAQALWNASYDGNADIVRELLGWVNADIVKELLEWEKLDFNHFCKELTHESCSCAPLHVAVYRGHVSVVEVFCAESQSFSCHEEDHKLHQTPLEVATNYTESNIAKRKIQSILLQRPEVEGAVKELYTQRELTVGSANAIVVGAALIASVTYGGWLQPPLGYNTDYHFPEPLPAPPGSAYESFMAVEGHTSLRVFAIFNSLSFFFAIAAVVAGMETTCFIDALEETYIANTVTRLRYKLKRTTILFIVSVIFVLIAFASAGIAIIPPIKRHERDMYITIGLGGIVCLVFIGRLLLICVSKRFFKWAQTQASRCCRCYRPGPRPN
ncbi:hypothetical protein M758_12G046800 [Ceratodon purpureus]|uniref:PGG domain-containing protein n=1 Tax=Ceratodon purpureus TaxID=3225 RepID=A0A8T0G4P4_CERPU|nr:hypothetical protein KC19_12G044100 [Ceratodon purpureus]KAG0598107.1 hypothetical protein M758_12G046800 [Ceratodon purpureus]